MIYDVFMMLLMIDDAQRYTATAAALQLMLFWTQT